MYKVFVTDDEIAIREGIRNTFAWENSPFTLVGEAPDGEIALPMIRDEKPDILITDIRMPFMDGMKLCEEVRRAMPWIQIVILSGFDDFNYAQRAIVLGIKEYLLKPISSGELKQVLVRIAARIDEEQRERMDLDKLRRQVTNGKVFIRDQLIGYAMTSPMDEEESRQIIEQMRAFGINLQAPCYVVAEFSQLNRNASFVSARAVLQRLAHESRDTIYLSGSENGINAFVLGDNERDIEERAYSFARSALDELDRAGYGEVRVSIGETVNRFCDITRSMKSARHTRHIMDYRRAPARIMGVRDIVEEPPRFAPNPDIQPLFERMKYVELRNVKEQLRDYVNSLQAVDAHISISADYLRTEVLMTAFRIIKEAGGDPQKALDREWLEDEPATHGADVEAYVQVALMILTRAVEYRDAHSRMKGNPVVNKARQYLDKTFTDPNLTFQDVVDYVSMSSSHFSTVFSQETGVTFTEYLKSLRLTKAKELLVKTSMRSSEIAYSVGYNDTHYFSYLFKKNIGMTPSEYRAGGYQADKS